VGVTFKGLPRPMRCPLNVFKGYNSSVLGVQCSGMASRGYTITNANTSGGMHRVSGAPVL
jgi:hypothetical protein